MCKDINPVDKYVVACFPEDSGLDEACFKVPYDILILSKRSRINSNMNPFRGTIFMEVWNYVGLKAVNFESC